MIRRWIAKLFGFKTELEALRRQVEILRWDEPFGMWTRPAFLQVCQDLPHGQRWAIFFDLSDIGEMNLHYGYVEMDRRIRSTFQVLSDTPAVVGRWYSGDEIVIILESEQDPMNEIARLREVAQQNGFSFACTFGSWQAGKEPVIQVIETLSDHTRNSKMELRNSRNCRGEHGSGKFTIRSLNGISEPQGV